MLLQGRVAEDVRTHRAYITNMYGESANGHLMHCERVMDVEIDALCEIPLEKVLLVRLQVRKKKKKREHTHFVEHFLIDFLVLGGGKQIWPLTSATPIFPRVRYPISFVSFRFVSVCRCWRRFGN